MECGGNLFDSTLTYGWWQASWWPYRWNTTLRRGMKIIISYRYTLSSNILYTSCQDILTKPFTKLNPVYLVTVKIVHNVISWLCGYWCPGAKWHQGISNLRVDNRVLYVNEKLICNCNFVCLNFITFVKIIQLNSHFLWIRINQKCLIKLWVETRLIWMNYCFHLLQSFLMG